MKNGILVIGSYNVGLTISVERLPEPGETLLGYNYSEGHGGKGSNQAIAARRLGGKVSFVGCVGDDSFGKKALELWQSEGIDCSNVKVANARTGIGMIFVDKQGRNMIVVDPGANMLLDENDIDGLEDLFGGSALLLLQLEVNTNAVKRACHMAKKHGIKVILNPAPARILQDDILRNVDILTPNESELFGLLAEPPADMLQCSRELLKKGVGSVVVTLGKRGAMVVTSNDFYTVPAPEVDAVDPTGAGDAFNGALAVSLVEGEPLRQAVSFANYAGALKVRKREVIPGLPYRSELEEFRRNDILE
ncbi:MAG: ribokinase [Conexivisphaerales archaeon]